MSVSPAFGSRPEGPSKAVSHGLLGRDAHTSGLGLTPAYVVPFFPDAQVCVPVVCSGECRYRQPVSLNAPRNWSYKQ